MNSLLELANSCHLADTDKVTVRKKHADAIKESLNRPDILCELNKNSKENKRGTLTWDYLFKTVKQIFHLDFSTPIKPNDRGLAARRRQESLFLVKLVIQQAVRGGFYMKTSEIVRLLLEILHNEDMCTLLGAEFTHFLVKEMFTLRTFWLNLDSNICHQLVSQYCSLLWNSQVVFDRVVAAKAVCAILTGIAQHFSVLGIQLFPSFEKLFDNIDLEDRSTSVILEYTVGAINCLCRSTAADSRIQVCHLGEKIYVPLFKIWKSKCSEKIKDDLVEFYQLQMSYHHPGGSTDAAHGAYAVDWTTWKVQVAMLYNALYCDFDAIQSRSRYTSVRDVSPYIVKDNVVQLAADVCFQVFNDDMSSIEITQLPNTADHGSAPKRRRIETGWAALRETIVKNGNTLHAVTWLQLLTAIVHRYPNSMPADEYLTTLSSLCQLLMDCKLVEITTWLLRCLVAFSDSGHSKKDKIDSTQYPLNESCKQIWAKVYASASRFLTVYVTQDESLHLLAKLTSNNLFDPSSAMQWSIFHSSGVRRTNAALELFASCLTKYNISESVASGACQALRKSILAWLIPSMADDNELPEFVSAPTHLNTKLLADIAVGLTLRDTQSCSFSSDQASEESKAYTDTEHIYLLSTFDRKLDFCSPVIEVDSPAVQLKRTVLVDLREYLLGRLLEDVEYAIETSAAEVSRLESMAWQCSFVLHVVRCALQYWNQSLSDVMNSKLMIKSKSLLDKLSISISVWIQKAGIVQMKQVLSFLSDAVRSSCTPVVDTSSKDVDMQMAAICRNIFPMALVKLLFSEVCEKVSFVGAGFTYVSLFCVGDVFAQLKFVESNSSTLSSLSLPSVSSATNVACALDIDFDFENGESSQGNKSSVAESVSTSGGFDDEFAGADSPSGESLPGFGGGSLLLPSLLTDAQWCCILCVDILCQLSRHPESELSLEQTEGSNVVASVLIEDLLKLIDPDNGIWNCSRAFDLQLLRQTVRCLSSSCHTLNDDAVEILLTAISETCKAHRKDQEIICQVVIDSMLKLIPHLKRDESDKVSDSMADNRDRIVHMFMVFWKLADKMYDCQTQLAIVQCLVSFVQYDPDCEWTFLKSSDGEENAGNLSFLKDELPQALTSKHISVRLLAASATALLFDEEHCKNDEMKSRRKQEQLFDSLYAKLQDVLNNEGSFTGYKQQDEIATRTCGILHVLSSIAQSSLVCRKKSLFATLHMTRENNFDLNTVRKMLSQLSEIVGASDIRDYLTSYMPYCLNMWLTCAQYKLEEFPWQLCNYQSAAQFFRSHLATVVTSLVLHQNIAAVKEVADQLNTNHKTLLNDCLLNIFVHILPLNAASREPSAATTVRRQINTAAVCYDLLITELGKEALERSIIAHFEAIVTGIVIALYDSSAGDSEYSEYIRDSDPEPNPPFFSSSIVMTTMDYLKRAHTVGAKVSSLVQLLAKSQDGIQQVLLALSAHLSRKQTVQDKCRAMVAYCSFVRLMLKDFGTGLGGCLVFLLRELLHVLLSTICDATNSQSMLTKRFADLAMLSVDLLFDVISTAVKYIPEELAQSVPYIIGLLSNVISDVTKDEFAKLLLKISHVINFIVVDCEPKLKSTISLLDPLPDLPSLVDAAKVVKQLRSNESLEQEIRRFLHISKLSGLQARNRLRGLRHLHASLMSNVDELQELIHSCQGQKDALLTGLLCVLIDMTKSSDTKNYDKVSIEAGRCLGLIGPIDVGFVILRPLPVENELELALRCMKDDEHMIRCCKIFDALNSHLVDADIEIVQSASSTLKRLFTTKSGIDFYKSYQSKYSNKSHLLSCLHPFINTTAKSPKDVTRAENYSDSISCFQSTIDDVRLWNPSSVSYDKWIRNLVCQLISSNVVRSEILSLLSSFCQIETTVSELVFPYIIHDILEAGSDLQMRILSKQIRCFFAERCRSSNASSKSDVHSMKSVRGDEQPVHTMLSVIHYLRKQPNPLSSTPWDYNFWLDLDYLHVAKASLDCSSFFSALLYAEIWCEVKREELESSSDLTTQSFDSQLVFLNACNKVSDISVSDLMFEAYRAIGDPDGIYGCGSERLASTIPRIKMYEHENDWGKAVGSYDIEMSFNASASVQVGLLKTLKTMGYGHILDTYLLGLSVSHLGGSNDIREIQYEAACRSCKWDLDITTSKPETTCGYNQLMYNSLVGLKESNVELINGSLSAARCNILQGFTVSGEESLRSVYPSLAKLRCIEEIEDVSLESKSMDETLLKWQSSAWSTESGIEFEFSEAILAQRCTLARMSAVSELPHRQPASKEALFTTLETLALVARQAGRFNVAEAALCQVKRTIADMDSWTSFRWRLQEAQLFWARGEQETGKHLLKVVIDDLEKFQQKNSKQKARPLLLKCLVLYGDWLAVTRSESPSVVIECYFNKAASLLEQDLAKSCDSTVDAFHSLARYVDAQYQHIVDHMNSATFEAKQDLIRQSRDDTEKLMKLGETNSRYCRTLEKQRQIDELEQQRLLDDRERYMLCAVDNYMKCLRYSNTFDLIVFRWTSLWFNNLDSDAVNQQIVKSMLHIGSHKFLPLMYQLAARMSLTKTNFQTVLQKLIEKVVLDHPYHSLGIILSLANANADDVIMQRTKRKSESTRLSRSTQPDSGLEEDRVSAAKALVVHLKTSSRGQMIKEMEVLCNAYIELANVPVDNRLKNETKQIKLPNDLLISKIKELKNTAVATLETKIDLTGKYKDIVYVSGFQNHFTLAGGINLPKIISCLGSDGIARRQLVKGKDDLRQDAVMQQVFNMVNNLLAKNHETRRRCLGVRTYKVVPLSQRCGLLEWCEGTIPMGEYLVGANGAHQRYRPDDMKALDCRKRMAKAHAEGSDEDKYKVFQDVCRQFKPVFHHFFLEKFPFPAEWYERRIAYVRSVATNSMVGYILGLGDRHVQNILIDTKSAELIHIDLGVAFEQGRILPTPETVPFRLTRDVVDGMGLAGVEGVFRRCCEKTMELMHTSHEAILTILQVLLYDPLYAWTISPIRAYELQHRQELVDPNMNVTATDLLDSTYRRQPNGGCNQEAVNKVAERVLIRLRQKLSGLEDGVQLSVTGQVNHLIQAARDPKNLCRLFPGWQPYI